MPAMRVLYFSAHQIQAYLWRSGECTLEESFDCEAPGAAFDAYLNTHRRNLFAIVANVADEGFHHESIPFLQSRDRGVVVGRRLNQLFQNSPLSVAVSLGYEKTRRKDEKLALLGLTNPGLFDPAIKAMRAAEVKVAGIYSLPLLSSAMLERLKIATTRCLLVTVQDNTVRQTYFDGGDLVISRVAPLADSSAIGVTHAVGTEVARFQQYLLSQRTITRNDSLDIHVLLHQDLAQSAASTLQGSDQLLFHVHSLDAVAKKIGAKTDFPDSRSQALFVHLCGAAAPKHQFAPPALRKEYRLWQVSRGLFAAGVVTLACALAFAAKTYIDVLDFRNDTQARLAETAALDHRYQALVKSFPPVPIAKETLRQVVARYQAIERQTTLPQALLRDLSRALDRHPSVDVSRLEWSIGGSDGASQKLRDLASDDREVVLVEGTISIDAGGTARDLLADFEGFTAAVLGAPGEQKEVFVLQQPFDVTSSTSLRSGSGELSTQEPRKFSLALSRKVSK